MVAINLRVVSKSAKTVANDYFLPLLLKFINFLVFNLVLNTNNKTIILKII
jgi:hypothetical protein